MCDYCDCRSITEIGELSDEHEQVLAVTHRLRHRADAGLGEDEVAGLLAGLRGALEPHTQREEAGIFAVLATIDTDPSYRQRFLDDHVDIDGALVAAIADHSRIAALVELVERHVFEEETDLYPAIRQLFAPSDWHEIEHRLHHHGAVRTSGASRALPSTV